MGNLVEVVRFFDPEEAYCAKGFLRSRGIDTIIQNEHHLTMAPWLRVALGGYCILTMSELEEDARQALKSISKLDSNERPLRAAPFSGAIKPQKRKARNWFWLPVAFMLAIPFIPLPKSKWGAFMQYFFLTLLYALILLVVFYWWSRARQIADFPW
jgi:hypothetical protein